MADAAMFDPAAMSAEDLATAVAYARAQAKAKPKPAPSGRRATVACLRSPFTGACARCGAATLGADCRPDEIVGLAFAADAATRRTCLGRV